MKDKFILFRRRTLTEETPHSIWGHMFSLSGQTVEGDEWKDGEDAPKKKVNKREILEFVGEASDPKEIAKHVRKNPLDRYVLFRGTVEEVNVPIHVIVAGRNLDTMGAEGWE